MREIRFDDMDALQAEIRDDYGPWSPALTVTQAMIDDFARLTGDEQWIHVDVERARRESPYGGTIAHGFLLLSLMPCLQPPAQFAVVGHKSALNYGSAGLRFLSPVPAGSDIHARQRLQSVAQRRQGTLLTTEFAIHSVGEDERPALLYNLQVLYAGEERR